MARVEKSIESKMIIFNMFFVYSPEFINKYPIENNYLYFQCITRVEKCNSKNKCCLA